MAKAKTLDAALDELFKDYQMAVKIAAQEATDKAKDDLYNNALSCLVQYYEDYSPSSYDRTYSLKDCFVPYASKVRESANGYICRAGVSFDPSLLADTYSGSDIYTPTDPEWIIDNYLAGIHPRTDGSMMAGGGNYDNEKYYGSFVPSFEMQRFIDGYNYTFYDNFRLSLAKQVLKIMKK